MPGFFEPLSPTTTLSSSGGNIFFFEPEEFGMNNISKEVKVIFYDKNKKSPK
jgi:hypothetical protein